MTSVVHPQVHASTFSCGQCGASLAFAGVRTELCPYCTSPNFVERPPAAHQPDPTLVVAFAGSAEHAKLRLDRWIGRRMWVADPALRHARVDDIRGIYVPAYLYSALARTEYTAQIGEHYKETKLVHTKNADGSEKLEERTVTRTEHRPLSGRHVGYVTDVVVSASQGLAHAELAALEPFDLRALRRFSPALISGWITEEFARDADQCCRQSRADAIDDVGTALRRFMPGDSFCDLVWRTTVEWESLEPILVPIWVLAVRYRDDRPALRILINGQTGKVHGKAPLSWWKVTLAIAIPLLVAAAIVLLWLHYHPEPPP